MNHKATWESIGRFFYTTNFSLLISAIIVWDTSLLDLIPRIANNEILPILTFFGVLMLLAYFIIDWLDANIVSTIDKEVKLKDIIFWLLAPIFLSFTLTILLKKSVNSSSWLYFGFLFYLIYNFIILLCRNRLIYDMAGREFFNIPNLRNKYDRLHTILIVERIFCLIILIILGVCIYLQYSGRTTIKDCETILLTLFVFIITLNTILKFCRYKYVNYEFHKKKLETK